MSRCEEPAGPAAWLLLGMTALAGTTALAACSRSETPRGQGRRACPRRGRRRGDGDRARRARAGAGHRQRAGVGDRVRARPDRRRDDQDPLQGGAGGRGRRPALHHRPAHLRGRAAAGRGHARPAPGEVTQAEANLERDTAQPENAEVRGAALPAAGRAASWSRASSTTRSARKTAPGGHASTPTGRRWRTRARPRVRPRPDEAAGRRSDARLQLAYTEIRAPIDGRTGNLLVQAGQRRQGQRRATRWSSSTAGAPDLRLLRRARAAARRASSATGRRATLRVEALLAGGRPAPCAATLTFVNNTVDTDHRHDPAQGHLREHRQRALAGAVRRRGAHADHRDRRGGGAVAGRAGRPAGAVRVRGQAGPHRGVAAGRGRAAAGRDVVIDKRRWPPGERVVIDGQLRLVPGARVEVKPAPAAVDEHRRSSSAARS